MSTDHRPALLARREFLGVVGAGGAVALTASPLALAPFLAETDAIAASTARPALLRRRLRSAHARARPPRNGTPDLKLAARITVYDRSRSRYFLSYDAESNAATHDVIFTRAKLGGTGKLSTGVTGAEIDQIRELNPRVRVPGTTTVNLGSGNKAKLVVRPLGRSRRGTEYEGSITDLTTGRQVIFAATVPRGAPVQAAGWVVIGIGIIVIIAIIVAPIVCLARPEYCPDGFWSRGRRRGPFRRPAKGRR